MPVPDRNEQQPPDANDARHPSARPDASGQVSAPPTPPDALKPWYYQGWFIVPTFVWWPCSAVLFIRSPWHDGVVSGALSWAWIIVGGGWIFLRTQSRWQNGESLVDPTMLALAAPGVALTILTQSLWLLKDRPRIRRIRDAGGFAWYERQEPTEAAGHSRQTAGEPRRRSNRGSVRSRRRRR